MLILLAIATQSNKIFKRVLFLRSSLKSFKNFTPISCTFNKFFPVKNVSTTHTHTQGHQDNLSIKTIYIYSKKCSKDLLQNFRIEYQRNSCDLKTCKFREYKQNFSEET